MKHVHIEGTGKPLKVVSPVTPEYLTSGKEYIVNGFWDERYSSILGWAFTIQKNNGEEARCLEHNCSHIGHISWIVTEREQ